MQQALQPSQNGDFILVWLVGYFVAFRVGMGYDTSGREQILFGYLDAGNRLHLIDEKIDRQAI